MWAISPTRTSGQPGRAAGPRGHRQHGPGLAGKRGADVGLQPVRGAARRRTGTSILSEKVSLSSGQTRYFPVDVPEGTRRLVFSVVDGELTEKAGQVQLLLKRGAQPSGTSYDYRSVRSHNVSLG